MDLQETSDSCGRAVFREALRTLYPRRVGDYVEVKEHCRDFLSLSAEFRSCNVAVSAKTEMRVSELKEAKCPCVVQVCVENRMHFALIKGFTRRGKARIYDPSLGPLTVGEEELGSVFTGSALLLCAGDKREIRKTKRPQLAPKGVKFGLAVLSLVRAICAFLLFAMVSDSDYALGAILPLFLFLLALGGTVALVSYESRRFVSRSLLPQTKGSGDLYTLGVKTHTREVARFEAIWDSLSFILLVLVVCCLQDSGKTWLFVACIVLFAAVESFALKLLERLGARSSLEESRMLKSGSEGKLKKAQKSSSRYVAAAMGLRALAFGLLALAVLAYTSKQEGSSASDFVSDYLILAGAGLAVMRIFASERDESKVRVGLYRMGAKLAWALSAKRRGRGYNPPADGKESSGESAAVR